MSSRPVAVVALMGFLLCATASAEAARRSDKKSTKRSEKRRERKAAEPSTSAAPKKTRRGTARSRRSADTSLRGRFASIPTPQVAGAGKIRLELRPSGAGDGKRGKVFSPRKLKANGTAGPTFKQRVLASTRKSLRKQ